MKAFDRVSYRNLVQRITTLKAELDAGEVSRDVLMVKHASIVSDLREYLTGGKNQDLLAMLHDN